MSWPALLCQIAQVRSVAVLWFGASVFLAPVLLLACVVGVVRAGRGGARRHAKAFRVTGAFGLVLLAGLPVWMTQYAQ